MRPLRVSLALAFALTLALPAGGWAQESPDAPRKLSIIPPEPYPPPAAGFSEHLGGASVNALLTVTVAGIRARLGGESFQRAFLMGSVGGTVAYLGKWTATRDGGGAGWVGRWIHGVGLSVADNGARGVPALSRVVLPAGPLRLSFGAEVRERGDSWIQLDLVETGGLLWAATRSDLEFDGDATFKRGGFVFESRSDRIRVKGDEVDGWLPVPGVILVSRDARHPAFYGDDPARRGSLQTLQYDWAQSQLADPLGHTLLDRVERLDGLRRYLVADPILFPLRGVALGLTGPWGRDTPWTREAELLLGGSDHMVYFSPVLP